VGRKAAAGQVELVTRATGTSVDVALPEAAVLVKKRVQEEQLLAAGLFEPITSSHSQELEAGG
jgi:hypothetical protein